MHTKAWGEMTTIAQRELGAGNNHHDFDTLPIELTEGFSGECTSCHTTCGQCHVSRPESVHGGFIDNHRFKKTPDQINNCQACHGSRIATDYEGHLSENKPDVHYQSWMKCWDCHTENMHADASNYESRYHLPDLPKCEDCHSGTNDINAYHRVHWPEDNKGLSCFVCHSQPYNNCNSCHTKNPDGDLSEWWQTNYGDVPGETDVQQGAGGYLEYPDFKIGYNYNQELHKGKFIVVRHIPIVRDSYRPWGHQTLSNYDVRPTWEYTSPHNIQRFTPQTDTTGGVSCGASCHIEGNKAQENLERFLWQIDVDTDYPDESVANQPVVVDERLPNSWLKP
jgi:thiosulfate/3-mercaptopyruvate sulfurtransferase